MVLSAKDQGFNPGKAMTYVAKDSIGTFIRMLRQQSGLTQENLADALGVGRSLVARWETDRGGEAFYIARIAKVLGVLPEVFLNRMASQNAVESITLDEAEVLSLYRDCDVAERIRTRRFLERLRKRRGV